MKDAAKWFAQEGVKPAQQTVKLSFDMRYVGQNFELPVPISNAKAGKAPQLIGAGTLKSRFYAVHDQFYGFHNDEDPIEIVNLRLTATAAVARLGADRAQRPKARRAAPIDHRPVWFSRHAAGAHADL